MLDFLVWNYIICAAQLLVLFADSGIWLRDMADFQRLASGQGRGACLYIVCYWCRF